MIVLWPGQSKDALFRGKFFSLPSDTTRPPETLTSANFFALPLQANVFAHFALFCQPFPAYHLSLWIVSSSFRKNKGQIFFWSPTFSLRLRNLCCCHSMPALTAEDGGDVPIFPMSCKRTPEICCEEIEVREDGGGKDETENKTLRRE